MYNPAKGNFQSMPVVIDFHGSGACGAGSASYTGWKEIADSDNLVVIFPQANGNWMPFDGPNGDVGYVRDIIDSLVATASVRIDPARVYLAGHSAGCSMAQNMAVVASDIVAGVACHSLFLTVSPSRDYSPVPVIEVHGTQDFVPYDGALSNFEKWKQINGCQGTAGTSNYDGFTQQTYQQCNGGVEVSLITVPGGGHNVYSVRSLYDTTRVAWGFLKRFTNPSKLGMAVGTPSAGPFAQQVTMSAAASRAEYRPTYYGNYGYNQYPANGYNQYPASGYYDYHMQPAPIYSYPTYGGGGYSPWATSGSRYTYYVYG